MLYNFVVYIGTYVIWRVVSVFFCFFCISTFFHALYMLQMNTIYNVFMLLSQARERLKIILLLRLVLLDQRIHCNRWWLHANLAGVPNEQIWIYVAITNIQSVFPQNRLKCKIQEFLLHATYFDCTDGFIDHQLDLEGARNGLLNVLPKSPKSRWDPIIHTTCPPYISWSDCVRAGWSMS